MQLAGPEIPNGDEARLMSGGASTPTEPRRRPGYETYRPPSVSGGGASAMASRVAQMGTQVAFLIMTARLMEPEGRGFYALASTTAILCGLPLGSVWASNAIEMKKGSNPSRLLGASLTIAAVGGVATAIAAILISLPLGNELWVIAFPAIMTPFILSARYSEGMYQALGHVGAVNRIVLARALLPLLFIAPPLLIDTSTRTTLFVWALSFPALAAVSFYGLPGFVGGISYPRTTGIFKKILGGASRLALATGALLINAQIAVIALAIFRNEADVGVYSVAVAAGAILGVATAALELSGFRRISAGDRSDSINVCARSVRHALVLTVGGAALIVPFLALTLEFIVGPGYEDVPLLLVVLLPGIALIAATRPIDSFFTVQLGRIGIVVRLAILMLAIALPANLILVPLFGAVGAALALSVSSGISALAYFWYFLRTANLKAPSLIPGTDELVDYYQLGARAISRVLPATAPHAGRSARRRDKAPTRWTGAWRLVAGPVALGLAVGLAFSLTQPVEYGTTTTLVLSPSSGPLDPDDAQQLPVLASTVESLVGSDAVVREARGRYVTDASGEERQRRASEATPEWIIERVQASAPFETALVQIEAVGPSQAAATSLAAAVADSVIARLERLEDTESPTTSGLQIERFGAGDELGQTSPTPLRNLLIGANLGLAVGVILLALAATRRPPASSQESLAAALGGPVLHAPAPPGERWATRLRGTGIRLDSADPEAGELQVLSALVDTNAGPEGSSVAVVGPMDAWALRAFSIELAAHLTALGRTIVVVEADSHGTPFSVDGEQPADGLVEAIDEGWELGSIALPVRRERWDSADEGVVEHIAIVPVGTDRERPEDLLASAGFVALLRRLEQSYDHVVVVGPSAVHESDSVSVALAAGRSIVAIPPSLSARHAAAICESPEGQRGRLVAFVRLGSHGSS